jgi:hypothetical protein
VCQGVFPEELVSERGVSRRRRRGEKKKKKCNEKEGGRGRGEGEGEPLLYRPPHIAVAGCMRQLIRGCISLTVFRAHGEKRGPTLHM